MSARDAVPAVASRTSGSDPPPRGSGWSMVVAEPAGPSGADRRSCPTRCRRRSSGRRLAAEPPMCGPDPGVPCDDCDGRVLHRSCGPVEPARRWDRLRERRRLTLPRTARLLQQPLQLSDPSVTHCHMHVTFRQRRLQACHHPLQAGYRPHQITVGLASPRTRNGRLRSLGSTRHPYYPKRPTQVVDPLSKDPARCPHRPETIRLAPKVGTNGRLQTIKRQPSTIRGKAQLQILRSLWR